MSQLTINTDYFAIISGTDNSFAKAYTEAKAETEKGSSKAFAKMKSFITSIENIAASGNVKDERITSSRGDITQFSGYHNIQTAINFIKENLNSVEPLKDLVAIHQFLVNNSDLYVRGYSQNIHIIQLEYESAVYLIVTGLAMIMSTSIDLTHNGKKITIKKKNGATRGVIAQTARNLSKEMNSRGHKDYLEAMLTAREMNGVSTSVSTESTAFTENVIVDTLELVTSVVTNINAICKFAKKTFIGVRQSLFGIVPLIRAVMYLRYKKKADTIAELERQCFFIQKNIEQLENISDMDPEKKALIIKKQQAYIEAYMKRAEKLRAELMETEREAVEELQKSNNTIASNSNTQSAEDDFVLEHAGIKLVSDDV